MFSINHPLFWLVGATFLIAVGFAGWSALSVHRRQKHGKSTGGIGGPNDPMS